MSEEIYYMLLFCVPVCIIILVVCILCNNDFWQGFRNSKFLDKVYKGEFDVKEEEITEPTERM